MASARASQAAASAHRNSQAGADALPGGAAAPAYGNGRAASAPGASAAGAAARKVAGQAQAPVSPAAAQPGGDPDRVRRSAVALAACLACDICGGMLDDPVTAPECMHRRAARPRSEPAGPPGAPPC